MLYIMYIKHTRIYLSCFVLFCFVSEENLFTNIWAHISTELCKRKKEKKMVEQISYFKKFYWIYKFLAARS